MGSAWMPWLRPIIGVRLCSRARFLTASRTRSTPASRRRVASRIWTASVVSSTSEEVIPLCRWRAGGPPFSSTKVRKAMTSCLTVFSISSMRDTSAGPNSNPAKAFSSAAWSSAGTSPSRAMASQAASSTSSQMR